MRDDVKYGENVMTKVIFYWPKFSAAIHVMGSYAAMRLLVAIRNTRNSLHRMMRRVRYALRSVSQRLASLHHHSSSQATLKLRGNWHSATKSIKKLFLSRPPDHLLHAVGDVANTKNVAIGHANNPVLKP